MREPSKPIPLEITAITGIDDAMVADFLKAEIYRGEIDLLIRRIEAYDRFSDRV